MILTRKTGVLTWINDHWRLLAAQLLILAVAALAFRHFVLGNYVEAFDDNTPSVMLICRGKWNDFANCSPSTLTFRSYGACQRAVEPAFYGIKGFAHTASVTGPLVQVNITCVPSTDYKALYPEKVTKELAGRRIIGDGDQLETLTQPVPQADTGPPAGTAAPPAGPAASLPAK